MAIPQGFIQDLLQRVDVVEVVGRHVQLKKTGSNFSGLCPFHSEKSPSFTVSPSKQFYHCFGCGQNGDAIRFLMEHNGMSFIEAVQDLAQQHGLQVPEENISPQQRAQQEERKQKQATLTDVLERAGADYRKQLKQAPVAIDYLKNRGLTGRIALRFGMGYAPAGWHHLTSVFPEYTDPLLEEAGLVIRQPDQAGDSTQDRRYDRFRHRIMFPIRNVKGECIGFGGRVLGDDKPKYLNSPETPVFSKGRELYGLFEARDALRSHGYALVTEGYMDVVALAQLGFANAVATLGTACTPEHVHKLFRYTDQIVFSFDGDKAGQRAAHKALVAALPYASDTRSVKFLFLPPEHDPDSFIRAHGPEAFSAQVQQALPLSQFLIQVACEDCDLATAEGRARMSSQARPLWQALPDGALKAQLLAELAAQAQLTAADLQHVWQAQGGSSPHGQPAPRQSGSAPAQSAPATAEWRPASGQRGQWQKQPWKKNTSPAVPVNQGRRSPPASRADHALRLLLLHMPFWGRLPPALQGLLCALPIPHGPLFGWIDSQYQEHGALAWGALQESLPQVAWGDVALQLVQNYQTLELNPSQDEALAELRSAVTWLHADELDRQANQAAAAGDLERVRTLLQQKTALDILPPAQQD